MQILTVIPIARGISKENLTYFTKNDVSLGSIVPIPLRKKKAYGLVIASQPVTERKSELKNLSYNLKKIADLETHSFFSNTFINTAKEIADYNAGSLGAVLFALVPKVVLENLSELDMPRACLATSNDTSKTFYETFLIQSDYEERFATYKSIVREEFAKGRSVIFIADTIEDLLNSKLLLEKGIEKFTFAIYSGLAKKEILSTWQKIISEEHPVLIVATGPFLSIPRNDLGAVILEKESSNAYKMQVRPYLDIRTVVKTFAKFSKIKLVLGDIMLRAETLWEEKRQDFDLTSLKFRSLSRASCQLIYNRIPQNMKKKEFSILSETLKNLLKKAIENNEHTFLFCGRKGLYPITVCSDCGTTVICKNCNTPVVLYKDGNKRAFICHRCGEKRDASELCLHCRGWRLNPLGIGVDRVAEEIKVLFPDINVIVFDKDHIKTHKQAIKWRNLFYDKPGSIMIGTEMALLYLNKKLENGAVVSIDSLLTIPDFRINEKIFHILLSLRSISEKNFLVQTRLEENSLNQKVFDYALKGNLIDFYRDEIEERKIANYPPFRTHIKISLQGKKDYVRGQMQEKQDFMKPYNLKVYDAWNAGSKEKFLIHGLISLPKDQWVDKNLLDKLRSLPQNYSIKIDPDTLL